MVSQAQFNQMFPNANSFYSYSGLVAALSSYPGFATTGGTTVEEQEAAAFLANVDHETGGLVYINEIDQSGDYCASESYGCPAGTSAYYGRGPLQRRRLRPDHLGAQRQYRVQRRRHRRDAGPRQRLRVLHLHPRRLPGGNLTC